MKPNRWTSPHLRRLLIAHLCGLTLAVTTAQAQAVKDPAPEPSDKSQTQPETSTKVTPAAKAPDADATKSPSVSPSKEEDAVVLSPFEVVASNKGYMASNTASGTRLNSKLEDLASPISVVTKQQLMDTAAIDLNDIFRTETNVEGLSQYTEYSLDRGAIVDTASNNPESANRIRGMTSANITSGGMSVSGSVPIDIYNVDSVEINRGANSNIFGIGSTSGTVNLNIATGNMSRDFSKVGLSTDSNGTMRETVDLNRVIIKNKLAVRLTAVNDEREFVRKPSFDHTKRFTIAVRAQPFKQTSFKASYESFKERYSRPNMMTPVEAITSWRDNGAYTWNPSNFTVYDSSGKAVASYLGAPGAAGSTTGATALRSTYRFAGAGDDTGNQRPVIGYIDGGIAYFTSLSSWTFNRFGTPPATGSVQYDQRGNQRMVDYELPTIRTNVPDLINPATGAPYGLVNTNLDRNPGVHGAAGKAIYDWTKYNINAANLAERKAGVFRYELEQTLVNTKHQQLAVQVASLFEDVDSKSRNFIGNGGDGVQGIVYLDVNQTLPNGTPNPGYLRPLIRGRQPQMYWKPEKNFTNKAQAAYVVNFSDNAGWTKWFGHHNFLGYGEYRERKFSPGALRYKTQLADADGFIRSVGNTDSLNTRYYLGDAKGYNIDDPTTTPPTQGTVPYTYWSTEYGPTGNVRFEDPQWRNAQGDLREVYFSGGTQRNENRSLGLIWQGYLLKDRIIPTLGFRKDRIRFSGNNPFPSQYRVGNQPTDPQFTDPSIGLFDFPDTYNVTNFRTGTTENKGSTRTQGIVLKPFTWLHLTYNRSSSFDPANLAIDTYGEILPSPTGTSQDYGVRLNLLKDRLWVSVNKYEATTTGVRNGAANVVAVRVLPFDIDTNESDPDNAFGGITSGTQKDLFDWYFYRIWGDTSANANGQPGYNGTGDAGYRAAHNLNTTQQVTDYVYGLMQYDKEIVRKVNNVPNGTQRTSTNDVTSKGYELEVNYHTRYWNLKITGADKKAIDSNLAAGLTKYITERQPILEKASFTNTATGITESYWNTTFSSSGTATRKDAWYTDVLSVYNPLVANLGKPRPQVRKYSLSATTSYNLAGLTSNKILRSIRTGGTLSWASKAAIGYKYGTPELDPATGLYWIRSYNPNSYYYDKARYTADAWIAYDFKIFAGRIKSSLQLNVKNVLEDGHLQAIAVNTDGTPHAYRIVDPRLYQLSWNLEL